MKRKVNYSFEQWCNDNERNDLLNRWDYELNDFLPSEISAKTEKKIWIKCPTGKHGSELHNVDGLAYGKCYDIHCDKCDSFTQGIIDAFGNDYLNKIWSENNSFSPWEISCNNAHKNAIFRCIEKDHEFQRTPQVYWKTQLCPICEKENNSIAVRFPASIGVWSDLNDDTPYDYTLAVSNVVWWKCNNGIHEDYKLGVKAAVAGNFVCLKCREKVWHPKYGNRLNLTGKRFGNLLVESFFESRNNTTYWNCVCNCGKKCIKPGYLLNQGRVSTCGDRTIHFVGESNPNWRGGVTPENFSIRASKEYDEWRIAVYKKDGYKCLICGSHDNLEGHHIYPFADFPELRLDVNNGATLCKKHHSTKSAESFHSIYGCNNNTPQQFEEYVNLRRKQLGINKPFNIDEYMNNFEISDNIPNPYIVNNPETNLCSISIPLADAELIWGDHEYNYEIFDIEEE